MEEDQVSNGNGGPDNYNSTFTSIYSSPGPVLITSGCINSLDPHITPVNESHWTLYPISEWMGIYEGESKWATKEVKTWEALSSKLKCASDKKPWSPLMMTNFSY